MAAFHLKTNRKQISIILNLIKCDCIALYQQFRMKKPQLKQAIELYEEFMIDEINALFPNSNSFSEIVLNHRKKFATFVDEKAKLILDDATLQNPISNGTLTDESLHVLYMSLQEWLIQGPKGQQIYFMIDIDSFNYTQYSEFQNFTISKQRNNVSRQPTNDEKVAKLNAIDFVHETFLAFKEDKTIDCDNYMKNNVKQIHYSMKKNDISFIGPTKCVFLLLKRIFFGLSSTESYDSDDKTFTANVCVSYNSEFSHKSVLSQNDARNRASMKALQHLCDIENKFVQRKRNDIFPPTFAQEIHNLIFKACEKYTDIDVQNKSNVIAGVVQTHKTDLNTLNKVVVLSSGTKHIDAEKFRESPLDVLPDTHAEVVARRCLMLYFYQQLEIFLNQAKSQESIFEKSPSSDRIRLKENIRFHLYISIGPCGDATQTNEKHPDRGSLLAKIEKSMGYKKLIDLTETQNASNLQTRPLYTMTCSDKIARWNVVGVQGALLSRIIEPIYFDSIILGKLLSRVHITNSFYGRIENSIGCLPRFYYHNKPFIAFTDAKRRNTHHEAPKISYNWICGSELVEKIESRTGKLISHDGVSRLSKRKLLHSFLEINRKLNYFGSNNDNKVLYSDEKLLARDFQEAKNACIDAFKRSKLGNWGYAQKDPESDRLPA